MELEQNEGGQAVHTFARHRHGAVGKESTTDTRGLVMNWGWRYDLLVWGTDLLLRGSVRQLRRQAIALAQLQPGERVLDVGCGTGTLALLAQERVGETGRVAGIDPGPRQIARARAKAARCRLPIAFSQGVIEQLPFADHSFDVVLSTLMMHHLPDDLKRRGLTEIARVLTPEGRLVVVDFKHGAERGGQPAQLGAGALGIEDLPALLAEAGFAQIESGEIRFPRLFGLAGAGSVRGRRSSMRGSTGTS
jgi:ubiquinone/menaquinone biosynthesis C-methylase UbiE